MKNLFIPILIYIFLSSCQFQEKENFDIYIKNVAIVDVTTGEVIPEQVIGITNDTIRLVANIQQEANYTGSNVVDAKGKYVIPGLWDNHVHFRGGDSLISENKDLLPLFLAFGITTVRDAGGDITPSVLEWRNAINKGEMDGPKIFTSGPKLDGKNPAWPGSIKVTDSADINKALDSLQKLEVDYVKMYDGSLTKEMYYGIIKESEKRGLKSTGHMPMSANMMEAAELGLDGSEHLYYVLKACSPLEDSLTQLNLGYQMMSTILDTYEPELASKVFSKLASDKVYVTPTLFIGKTLSNILKVDHEKDSLLNYIDPSIQKTYIGRIEGAKRAEKLGSTMRQDMEERSTDAIKPMFEAGVPLLAGSDCGPYNSFVYPGESLHGELRSLVNAGLSPQQALQTSYMNGPAFFDLQQYYGSIEKDKVGDLVLLDKNPLENIEFAKSINIVITKNKVYNKAKLDEMLEAVRNQ